MSDHGPNHGRDSRSNTAGTPNVRRYDEQHWLLDNVIRSVGMEWDQPRLMSLIASLGPEAGSDIAGIRNRVGKMADIPPAFEAAALRREAKAAAALAANAPVTARDNFYMASNYWASAQWGLDENSPTNMRYNERKRACYAEYAKRADHRVEEVWIPFEGRALPAWLHFPAQPTTGKIPLLVSAPGMDGFKERSVTLYGDPVLSRGAAVLCVEGPGQYESANLGIYVSMPSWIAAGKAIFDWVASRAEFDLSKVAIVGRSFGTFFATIAAANEPRYCALALQAPCFEPGCRTLFEKASPTYKRRFMYMSGYTDEAAFDAFAKTLSWEPHVGKLKMPTLCVAGESDELSPHHYARRLFGKIDAPRSLVVYQDARHTVTGVPSSGLGPSPAAVIADWVTARFAGTKLESEIHFVDTAGRVNVEKMTDASLRGKYIVD